jgi:Tfp pilus assembly protein PilX
MLSELKPHSQRGVTLIIALIMVIIIGLTSAAAMRGATSSEKVVNNIRMQNLAQQYAEAALRYCESQLLLADGSRPQYLAERQYYGDDISGASVEHHNNLECDTYAGDHGSVGTDHIVQQCICPVPASPVPG